MISSNSVYLNYIIRIRINYWRNLSVKFSACILTSKFSTYYFYFHFIKSLLVCCFNFMLFFSVPVENTIVLMSSSKKATTQKMLRKWESEFSIKLEFDTNLDSKIYCVKCSDCKKWETRINSIKNVSKELDCWNGECLERCCWKTF